MVQWAREFKKTESLVYPAATAEMSTYTVNKITGTFVKGRRSPRLAVKRGESTVEFAPRVEHFPPHSDERVVAPVSSGVAQVQKRTSPRLAEYNAKREVTQKAAQKAKAEKRRAFFQELRALEAQPAVAVEKTVFTIFYDPIDKKHHSCHCGKCEAAIRTKHINQWVDKLRPRICREGVPVSIPELTDLLVIIYNHPTTPIALRHGLSFRAVFRKKLDEFREHPCATPSVRLLCDALIPIVDAAAATV